MDYKGCQVPDDASLTGVKMVHRGRNKGKFQAFTWTDVEGEQVQFMGPIRETREEALLDAGMAQQKTRLYV
jgi:hypothetical protein